LKATRRYFRLIYTITTQGEDAQKVAEAETMNIAVNADRMIISLPQKYLGLLKVVQQIQEAQANA
jgi:acyl-CoA thioesterase FadM